jgi:uncharacterized protein YjbI with pentapeptide repeats
MTTSTARLKGIVERLISKVEETTEEVIDEKAELVELIRTSDNETALRLLEKLWVRGWLSDGTLRGANLREAHLQHAYLAEANLSMAILLGAQMAGANLQRANLERAKLRGATINNADLREANLSGAHLTNAILIESNLYGADMRGADFEGARLGNANLERANLTERQLMQAGSLQGCILPHGKLYNGRHNLPGDLEMAQFLEIEIRDPVQMAEFYGVSLDDYGDGQARRR